MIDQLRTFFGQWVKVPLSVVVLYAVALIFALVVGAAGVVGIVQQDDTQRCKTDVYAPFFAGVGDSLLDLDDAIRDGEISGGQSPLDEATRSDLEDAVAEVNEVADGETCA